MDTNKIFPLRLPRIGAAKPLRYLARRVIQVMAENAVSNFTIGQRSAPGSFLVIRLAKSDDERSALEQEFSESRGAIERQAEREAESREFRLRSPLSIDLVVLTEAEVATPETLEPICAGAGAETAEVLEQLTADGEAIVCQRMRSVRIESDPPGAAVYVDGRQMDRVTPCVLNDVPVGDHRLRLALPGHLLHNGVLTVTESGEKRQRYNARLEKEPPMVLVELVTFPAGATVRVGEHEGQTPLSLRLPEGDQRFEPRLDGYAPAAVTVNLAPAPRGKARRLELRLEYNGHDREEPVGRLIIYKPAAGSSSPPAQAPAENTLSAYFKDPLNDWDLALPEQQIAAQRPLFRGVLLIGREDPEGICPDVRLKDAGNTVSRGCHAWLHVYSDPGTGADYNTFVIHNNSSKGIRVDGRQVSQSVALGDDSVVEVGIFRMRILKQMPEPVVEV